MTEEVKKLQDENDRLRAGWKNDARALLLLAVETGHHEVARAARRCLDAI